MAKRVKWYPEMYDRYQDAMRIPLDQQLGKQSVFKKPYLYDVPSSLGGDDGFTRMEREGDSHSTSPWRRPAAYNQSESPAGPGLGSNCDPAIIDYGGSYFDCECENDCVIWMKISCSANVKKVIISGQDLSERPVNSPNWRDAYDDGVILHVTARGLSVDTPHPYEIHTLTAGGKINDTLMHPTSKAVQKPKLGTGIQVAQNGVISGIFENNCCKGCDELALSIGYTSQKMVAEGTQILTAVGGGTPPEGTNRYTWAITSGEGSLNIYTGPTVVYTAPSGTNVDCAWNPTITLKDCCLKVATLQIAIDTSGVLGTDWEAWRRIEWRVAECGAGITGHLAAIMGYHCDDSFHFEWICYCCPTIQCSAANCTESTKVGCCVADPWGPRCWESYLVNGCDEGLLMDVRTPTRRDAGCCPVGLVEGDWDITLTPDP